jgi:hypothetical protein
LITGEIENEFSDFRFRELLWPVAFYLRNGGLSGSNKCLAYAALFLLNSRFAVDGVELLFVQGGFWLADKGMFQLCAALDDIIGQFHRTALAELPSVPLTAVEEKRVKSFLQSNMRHYLARTSAIKNIANIVFQLMILDSQSTDGVLRVLARNAAGPEGETEDQIDMFSTVRFKLKSENCPSAVQFNDILAFVVSASPGPRFALVNPISTWGLRSFLTMEYSNQVETLSEFNKNLARRLFADVLPSQIHRFFVLASLAAALFSGNNLRVFQLWIGAGSNGKTHLLETLRRTFCEMHIMLARTLKSSLSQSGVCNPELIEVSSSKVLYCDEMGGERLSANYIKSLVGGASIKCRLPYQRDYMTKELKALIILPLNEMPIIPTDSTSIDDRLVIIQFPVRFQDLVAEESVLLRKRDREFAEAVRRPSFRLALMAHVGKFLLSSTALNLTLRFVRRLQKENLDPLAYTPEVLFARNFMPSMTTGIAALALRIMWDKWEFEGKGPYSARQVSKALAARNIASEKVFSRQYSYGFPSLNHVRVFAMAVREDAPSSLTEGLQVDMHRSEIQGALRAVLPRGYANVIQAMEAEPEVMSEEALEQEWVAAMRQEMGDDFENLLGQF